MTSNTPAAAGQADCRTRFIFDNMPVRGLHVRLQEVWQHIEGRKHYPAAIRQALGELLAAGALLLTGIMTTEQAYRAINWTTVILIGAMMPPQAIRPQERLML